MQITLNISRKHAAILGTLLFVIAINLAADYASSAAPGLTQWHVLSEITNDSAGNVRIVTASGKINSSFIEVGSSGAWLVSGSNIHYDAGNVGIGIDPPQEKLEVSGAIKFGNTGSGCDAIHRGSMKYVPSGAGIDDKLYQCMKRADNSYIWVLIARGW